MTSAEIPGTHLNRYGITAFDRDVLELGQEAAYLLEQARVHKAQGGAR